MSAFIVPFSVPFALHAADNLHAKLSLLRCSADIMNGWIVGWLNGWMDG